MSIFYYYIQKLHKSLKKKKKKNKVGIQISANTISIAVKIKFFLKVEIITFLCVYVTFYK